MTNEMKLLLAICEYLGLDVEKSETKKSQEARAQARELGHPAFHHSPVFGYKLTDNKPPLVPIEIQGPEWAAIVDFVTNHSSDIENSVNDFSTLKPVWEFMNRNC